MAKLPIATFAMAHPSELSQVKRQNQLISYHMVYYLLKEDSIRLNGYSNGNGHSNHMKTLMVNDKGFKDAISTLETSCIDLKVKHLRELEELVKELDISDSKLYSDYRESCDRLMDDDVRWGRITVLFFFTSILAKRLYTEGKTNKIQSLVGWQTQFLDDVAAQWILEHGGWVSMCCDWRTVSCVCRVYLWESGIE